MVLCSTVVAVNIGKDIQATIVSHIECQFPMSNVVIHTHKGKEVNPLSSRDELGEGL